MSPKNVGRYVDREMRLQTRIIKALRASGPIKADNLTARLHMTNVPRVMAALRRLEIVGAVRYEDRTTGAGTITYRVWMTKPT